MEGAVPATPGRPAAASPQGSGWLHSQASSVHHTPTPCALWFQQQSLEGSPRTNRASVTAGAPRWADGSVVPAAHRRAPSNDSFSVIFDLPAESLEATSQESTGPSSQPTRARGPQPRRDLHFLCDFPISPELGSRGKCRWSTCASCELTSLTRPLRQVIPRPARPQAQLCQIHIVTGVPESPPQ